MAVPCCALAELRSLSKGRWEVGDACELAITPDREADGPDENRATGSTDLHRDKTTYAGTIRFLGEAAIGSGGDEQARAMWVGVELSAPAGRNDGSVPTPANMLCLSGSLWLSLALSGSLEPAPPLPPFSLPLRPSDPPRELFIFASRAILGNALAAALAAELALPPELLLALGERLPSKKTTE